MGKKGTKRKTSWRTLSITDSTTTDDATTTSKNGTAEQSRDQASSKDDRYPNSSYLRRKPLFGSSGYVGRSEYAKNYYKQQNSAFSSSSSYSSRNSYHRRPFQNSASRFFNFRTAGRTGQEGNRVSDANKENYQARSQASAFNDEEYTRITTPRQDVIFKKGYLSQPRKYLSSTDTNTTSSAAASIVSTEESISAASVPSLSPEQCSSYADSIDPEQAFMYSYFDQNGVFYVNPCLPNGFDQYTGQMFMLPYSYQPYSVYLSDLNSPIQSTDIEEEENPTLTDSNENLSDKETNIKEMSKKCEDLPNDCDSKPEPPKSEEQTTTTTTTETTTETTTTSSTTPPPKPAIATSTIPPATPAILAIATSTTPPPTPAIATSITPPPTVTTAAITENNTEKIEESIAGNSKHFEIAPSFENYYNCGYQQFYPPVFVPYVYEQPFMPVIEPEYSGSYSECTEEESDKKDTRRKIQNRTTHTNNDGNSTGATTPDCSEEDCIDNMEDDATTIDEASCDTVIELKTPNNEETEKKIIFNANAKEFIPRLRKSHLNVNVKEFLPSNVVKPPNQGDNKDRRCSNNNDRRINSTTLKFKENNSLKKGFSVKTAKQDKSTEEKENDSKSIKNGQNDKIISNEEKTTNNLSKNIKDRLPITLTLAERIKKGLATTENNLVVAATSPSVKSSPPKHNNNNSANTIVNKKTPRRTTTTATTITAATTTTTTNDKRSANEKSPVVSFAQILTKSNHQKVTKTATSPVLGTASSINHNTNNTNNNNNNNIDKLPAKNIANNKLKIQETQTTTAEKSIVQDEWKTVKPKGKRRLFKDIAPHDELEPEKEQAYNNSSTSSSSNSSIELNKTASNATIIKHSESVPVVEKVTEKELHSGTICLNNESESTSEKDQITEDDGTPNSMSLENSQKQRTKTRNKKQKRSPNALKKVKGGDIMKQTKSNQKIDSKQMQKTNSKVIEVKDSPIAKTSYFTTPTTSSDEDLTIDSLYLLDRKNCILAKNFCKNPLEIFNGFDCKFNKGNSSILKEEEEMVLSVIKSLSTNQQSKQHEVKKSSPYSDTQQSENLVNFVNTEKSNRLGNGIKRDEDDCSVESHSDHTVENESSSQLSSIENEYSVLNGNEIDCDCINNIPDQQQQEQRQKEDIDENTVVQTLLSIDSPVNEKISDTESISDLSSDDCGRKIGSEKSSSLIYDDIEDTTDFDKNNSFEQSKKCYEEIICSDLEGPQQNSISGNMDTSSCLQNGCCELQNNNDSFDDVNDMMTIDSIITIETKKVPNNICSAVSNSEDHEYENSDVLNTEQYESIPTEDHYNASLHDNFSQDQVSNDISSDLNESNFLHFDLTQFKPEKEPEEKIDIQAIFEEKLKDIEEQLSRSSSTQNSPRKMILNEINSNDHPLEKEYLPSIEALQLAAVSIDMSSVIQITNEEDSKEMSLGKVFTSEEAEEEEEESRNSKNECHFNDVSAGEVILLKASTQGEFNETKVSLKEENIVDNAAILENVFHEENLYTNEPKITDSTSKESLPIMKDDVLPIVQDVPLIIAKDSPPIVKNALKIADNVRPMEEGALRTVEDNLPIIEDDLPIVEDALPTVEDNLRIVKDNLPIVEDAVPIVEDGLRTVVEDALPIVEDALPIVEDALPIVEDVLPIKETLLPTVKGVLSIESSSNNTTHIFNTEENDYQDDRVYGNGNHNDSAANVCSNTSKSCSSPIQVDSDSGNKSVVVPLEKSISEIPEEHIEKSNSSSSYTSPINNNMTKEYVTVITTTPSENEDSKNYNKIGGNIQDEIDYPEHYTSIETKQDSKDTVTQDSDPSNSTIVLTTISENLDDPNKYPLTMAVKQWLNTEIKEKTPEPMFRIPKDPALNTIITTSMLEQSSQTNESCEDWSSEDDDDDHHHESKKKEKLNIENKQSKNLQSNPSHVSSVNNLSLSKSFDRKLQQNDNDSDYNSDSQQRYDEDDNTCGRVAAPPNNITDTEKSERFDLLDYWDDEFVRNPKRWLDSQANNSSCPSNTDDMETQSVLSTTSPNGGGEFSPYQSVYGKSIDYNRLLASNYEFLSNNIISFNENSPNDNNDDMKKTQSHHRRTDNDNNNNDDVDVIISNGTMLLNNNNNNNFGNNINGNDNCLKPPEVCCIIM